MFERLKGSWELVKASWRVLLADKELIVFPVVSMIGAILVTATFIVPAILGNVFSSVAAGEQGAKIVAAVIAFLFYVVLYTVIFYCNTALVGAALIRLRGGDPTVSDGFRIANEHLGSIFVYALISATVGMILRWVRDRGILGRIAAGFFGLAWNVATYLVVPILVTEKISPVDAIKRSTALLRKTWGEQIVGNIGIGAVSGLAMVLLFIAGIPLLIVAFATNTMAIIVSLAVIWVLALIAVGLISSALNGIYTAAVYQFATSGSGGAYFEENQIRNAFRLK